ncbi:MAG: hypothetical protein Kow0068_14970 [Marinilabiliales bacterium]
MKNIFKYIQIIFFINLIPLYYSNAQEITDYNELYKTANSYLPLYPDSAQKFLDILMADYQNLPTLILAKTNYLQYRIEQINYKANASSTFIIKTDSLLNCCPDSILATVKEMIANSNADSGLALAIQLSRKAEKMNAKQQLKNRLNLLIAEGYRVKRDYEKGIYLL